MDASTFQSIFYLAETLHALYESHFSFNSVRNTRGSYTWKVLQQTNINKPIDLYAICNQSTYKNPWDISYSKRKGSWDLSSQVYPILWYTMHGILSSGHGQILNRNGLIFLLSWNMLLFSFKSNRLIESFFTTVHRYMGLNRTSTCIPYTTKVTKCIPSTL